MCRQFMFDAIPPLEIVVLWSCSFVYQGVCVQRGSDLPRYQKQPFSSHEEYVQQLKKVSTRFPDAMKLSDGKGKSMLEILKAGSSKRHYKYLMNNSVFREIAQGHKDDIHKGTMVNEAEHRSMKRWNECVYQQHQDRVEVISALYALFRMLGNSYKNLHFESAFQYDEKEAIFMLAGLVAKGALQREVQDADLVQSPATTRKDLKRPRRHMQQALKDKRQENKNKRDVATEKQANMDLKRGKKVLTKRVTGKSAVAKGSAKTVKRPRVRRAKDSAQIAKSISEGIANAQLAR